MLQSKAPRTVFGNYKDWALGADFGLEGPGALGQLHRPQSHDVATPFINYVYTEVHGHFGDWNARFPRTAL